MRPMSISLECVVELFITLSSLGKQMNYQDKSLQSLKLGQTTEYAANYDRTLLQPVPRKLNRDGLGIT